MKKRRLALLVAGAMIMAGLLAGCASKAYNAASSAPMAPMEAPAPAPAMDMAVNMESAGGWGGEVYETAAAAEEAGYDTAAQASTGQKNGVKIIRSASISLETRDFLAHVEHVKQRAEEMGGYVASSYVSGKEPESYYDSGRYASITVRIPSDRLDSFLADTRGLATVISENTTGEDITANYRDTESRLEVYTTQRERILELLKKAETMEDIIALETELSRLTYEIENLTGSLRRWDDLVDYSTVDVDLREIPATMPVAGADSFGTRVSEGLKKSFNGMAVFFENAAVFLISALPVLLVLGVLAAIVLLIVRRSVKKQAARRAEQGAYAPAASGYGEGAPPTGSAGQKKVRGKKAQKEKVDAGESEAPGEE